MTEETHTTKTPENVSDEWARTLRVTVEPEPGFDPDGDSKPPTLVFPDTTTAFSVFNDSTFELLQAIRAEKPASISAAARLVERDKSNVHAQLRRMAAYGVVEFIENGAAKRPIVKYDRITFDVSVSLIGRSEDEASGELTA